MKILHIIITLNDGGAQSSLFRLCKNDSKNSHTVISLKDYGKYGSLMEEEGINVVCINIHKNTLAGIKKLYTSICEIEPDAIQTWMYHADLIGGILSKVTGIDNLHWGLHNSDFSVKESSYSTIVIGLACGLLSRVLPKKIVSVSKKAKDYHEILGYDGGRFEIIPNGHDTDKFRPNENKRKSIRKELKVRDDQFLIGCVARWHPQKDQKNLVKAMSKVYSKYTEIRCLFVGRGLTKNNSDFVHTLHKEGVDNISILLGQRNDIRYIMNAIDIHVLPSAFGEAFPNVLCESMSCGTPCITTDVGDSALIVGDTGWVVPPKAPDLLASAIIEAIRKWRVSGEWKERQSAARSRIVNNFGIDRMVNQYHSLWSHGTD